MNYLYISKQNKSTDGAREQALLASIGADELVTETRDDRHDKLKELISRLTEGDCLFVESFGDTAQSSMDFLSVMARLIAIDAHFISISEAIDTRTESGANVLRACSSLIDIDKKLREEKRREGIARAKDEGRYRGRKPIEVDNEFFDSVVARWNAGEITARQAMAELNLKPNTFYRRVKERTDIIMTADFKAAEKALRKEMKELAKEEKEKAKALKAEVKAEAEALRENAEKKVSETKQLRDMEREIRKERRQAEKAHQDEIDNLKKEIKKEAAEFKSNS